MEAKKIGPDLIARIKQFLKETEIESKKVIWPDRKYVVAATIIVLIIVMVSSLYVMFLDFGLAKIFEFLNLAFKTGI